MNLNFRTAEENPGLKRDSLLLLKVLKHASKQEISQRDLEVLYKRFKIVSSKDFKALLLALQEEGYLVQSFQTWNIISRGKAFTLAIEDLRKHEIFLIYCLLLCVGFLLSLAIILLKV